MTNARTRRWPIGIFTPAIFAAGCWGTPPGAVELAAPGVGPSRAALVASLDAWKSGRRGSGVVIGSNPAVGVVDAGRAGRALLEYEVVGPLMVADKARPFAVRLTLDGPREVISARYVVLGRDPLWVFRQEDFERMLHWEHTMPDDAGAEPASTAAANPGGAGTDAEPRGPAGPN